MIHLINQINALNIKYSSNDQTFNLPVLGFCLSKYETAFGSFFSATYNKNCSLDDQAKQPNCAGKEIEKKKKQTVWLRMLFKTQKLQARRVILKF